MHRLLALIITMTPLLLSGCEGAFGWVYDDPEPIVPVKGELYLDATNWKKWYYLNLPVISEMTGLDAGADVTATIVSRDIPFEATDDIQTTHPATEQAGQYMYWFDALGEGLTNYRFLHFTPTAEQSAPDEPWTIAIHRNNVRTNPATVRGVWQTPVRDIEAVTKDMLTDAVWTADEWSEREVWDDQTGILLGNVPSQGIAINRVLSGWLIMHIPPVPPMFEHNDSVFVIALTDGTFALLRLKDYISPTGTKCCLTIQYKYPF